MYTLHIEDGVTLDKPGIYRWDVPGHGTYIGKYTNSNRPLKEYSNNVRKLLTGQPYRKSKPNAFRAVHRALASAKGLPIKLTIVANAGSKEELHALERQYIKMYASGGLNRTK